MPLDLQPVEAGLDLQPVETLDLQPVESAPKERVLDPYLTGWGTPPPKVEMGAFLPAFEPFALAKRAIDAAIPSFKAETPEMAQIVQMAGLEPARAAAETVAGKVKAALGSVASPGGVLLGAVAPFAPELVGPVVGATVAPQAVEGVKELGRGDVTAGLTDIALTTPALIGGGAELLRALPRVPVAVEKVQPMAAETFKRVVEEKPAAPVEAAAQPAAREAVQPGEPNALKINRAATSFRPLLRSGEGGTPEGGVPEDAGQQAAGVRGHEDQGAAAAGAPQEAVAPEALPPEPRAGEEVSAGAETAPPTDISNAAYQREQDAIDAIETRLEKEGVDPVALVNPNTPSGKYLIAEGAKAMPPELADAYARRDAIDKAQVKSMTQRAQTQVGDSSIYAPKAVSNAIAKTMEEARARSVSIYGAKEKLSPADQRELLGTFYYELNREVKNPARNSLPTDLKTLGSAEEVAKNWPHSAYGVNPAGHIAEAKRLFREAFATEKHVETPAPRQLAASPPLESAVTQAGGTGGASEAASLDVREAGTTRDLAEAVARPVVEPGAPSERIGAFAGAARKLNEIGAQLDHLREGFSALVAARENKADITRARDAVDTLAVTEGRQVFNSLRLDAPSRLDREAAFAIVEAEGDPAKLAAFVRQAAGKDPRAERAARRAITDLARLTPLADKVTQILDAQLAMEHNRGIDTQEHAAYVPHIIDTDLLMGSKRPVVLAGGGSGVGGGAFKKGRTFATIYDAVEAGYKPRSMDVAEAAEHRVRAGQSLINRKAWVDSMRGMIDPSDHTPLVRDVERRVRANGTAFETPPMGYQVREAIPGVRVAIHEGYTRLFDALTGHSSIGGSLVGKAVLNVEGALKHGLLLFDTFHASRILQKELFLTRGAGGYRKGLALLEYSDGDLAKAQAAGEIAPEMAAYARANRGTADLLMKSGLNAGKVAEALYTQGARHIPGVGTFNKWVFDKLTRGAMLESGVIEFERVKALDPARRDTAVAAQVSAKLNALYGNLGRQGFIKNPTLRDLAQIGMLAPQWVEGMARTEAGAAHEIVSGAMRGNPIAGTLARSVGQGLAAYLVGTQLLNLATRGHPTWQNPEKGHKLDAWIPDVTGKTPGYFLSPLSVVAELTHDALRYGHSEGTPLKAGARIARNKLSPLGRAVDTLAERKDYKGAPLGSDWDVLKAAGVALAPTPIPLSPLTRTDNAGQIQRQLTASLGVKTENAPSADAQIHERARDWALRSPDAKVRSAEEKREMETSAPSDYAALRKALRTQDEESARSEFTKLLQTHSMKQINAAMAPAHPVTGSRRMEGVFRASLDEAGRKLYQQAIEERRATQRRYFELRAKVAQAAVNH